MSVMTGASSTNSVSGVVNPSSSLPSDMLENVVEVATYSLSQWRWNSNVAQSDAVLITRSCKRSFVLRRLADVGAARATSGVAPHGALHKCYNKRGIMRGMSSTMLNDDVMRVACCRRSTIGFADSGDCCHMRH